MAKDKSGGSGRRRGVQDKRKGGKASRDARTQVGSRIAEGTLEAQLHEEWQRTHGTDATEADTDATEADTDATEADTDTTRSEDQTGPPQTRVEGQGPGKDG